jgi:CDP-glucose 4,6-dehydratase
MVKDLVELSIKNWGHGTWQDTSNTNQPHEAGFLKLDISKAKKKLNWRPKLRAEEAIQWTMDWYRKETNEAVAYTTQQINNYMSR